MDLLLDLGVARGASLRARLEDALRESIRTGRLAPGARLPPTRTLAAQLGVSRGVVVEAYGQLQAEGYLVARPGAGTAVAATGGTWPPATPPAGLPTPPRYDLSPFVPALDGFPRAAWRAALTRALRDAPDAKLGLPPAEGMPELRAALAAYLARARDVRATPEQVIVTNGLRQGLGLLWSTLAARGARRIAIEQAGWRGVAETAADSGLAAIGIPVDGDGLVVGHLAEHAAISAVAVAPAHQYPTGSVLAPTRRAALVSWARERGALIFEDDYDAEYRYDREPIGALHGLAPELVVYGGSTSKSLAPGVRLAWLVAPPALVAPLAALQRRRGGMPAALQQLALADFISAGELDRHLRRQRRRYRRQRDALLAALADALPDARPQGAAAGLFVVLRLPPGTDERALRAAARAAGIALDPAPELEPPSIVVGYANLPEAAIVPAVAALARAIRQAREQG